MRIEAEKVFDRRIPDLMEKWNIPGGAIAIVKDGRLVLAKGYGYADVGNEDEVQPDSLFRIASISKPITAVAVLTLVESGQLGLDDRVFRILDEFENTSRPVVDERIYDITVRHLLQHSGGWDSNRTFDPMFAAGWIENRLRVSKPVTCEDTIRFMLRRRLDFDPGARYAYSNFGYCILGRIIEKITEMPYEDYVKSQVLEPAGITRMRIGGTLAKDASDGEVTYYGFRGDSLADSVLPGSPVLVPWQYGGFHLDTMDSHGGWIASAIDLVRFATSVDGTKPPSPLKPETVDLMVSAPHYGMEDWHYGMGWLVRPVGDDANWWHDGSLAGTSSILVRTHHGMAWAVLFNSRPRNWLEFTFEFDDLMWQGVSEVAHWPSDDLFDQYGYE